MRVTSAISFLFCISLAVTGVPVAAGQNVSDGSIVLHASTAVVQAANYHYHNYSEIKAILFAIEAQHPDISKVYDIGDSWEKSQGLRDRDILALKISDNVAAGG